jgi:hypothetical protein
VIQRFQIEDLISQDPSGVLFRVLDTQTGHPVAVRRFFPFGADGGGLQADEQAAYQSALERLAGLHHPALRSVICGGCDPVDGMPYIATEWIEGESLQWFIEQDPLVVEVAIEVIDQALAVSELLSQALAKEAVWVETELPMIIYGNEQSGRRFTFWISPLKWLGGAGISSGLQSIITLTEDIMDWENRRGSDPTIHGLDNWLDWLRGAADTASLHEARAMLAAMVAAPSSPVAPRLAAPLAGPQIKARRSTSSKMLWVVNIGLAVVAVGLGEWVLIRKRIDEASRPLPVLVPPVSSSGKKGPVTPGQENPAVAQQAAEPGVLIPKVDPEKVKILATQRKAAEMNKGVISWNSRELLVQNAGKEVVVEGVFAAIGFSDSEKTLYLLFSKQPDQNEPRGAVLLNSAAADLTEDALKPLIGRKIRLRGIVGVQTISGLQRPDIKIKERASIHVIE